MGEYDFEGVEVLVGPAGPLKLFAQFDPANKNYALLASYEVK